MAIDTREKRQSVTGVGRPWLRSHDTTTIDEQWRISAGNAYGGNALSPAAGGSAIMNQLQSGNLGADLFNGAIL